MKFTGSTDILDTINGIATEKNISKESIIAAVERAATNVTKDRYGVDSNIVARIDRKTGELKITRIMSVVENIENQSNQILLNAAKRYDKSVNLGDQIEEILPHTYSDRGVANSMKTSILQEIRIIEKEAEYNEFKKNEHQIISCEVKQVSRFRIIVLIGGRVEAVIPREGIVPGEKINPKDRINAYITEVRRSDFDFQIVLSRTSPDFVVKLMSEEVSEIADGTIEVKCVARDPGSRAKVAVLSHDSRLDVIGTCIGARGSRIKPVIAELHGEKLDIIKWSRDLAELAQNAIVPAKAIKVNILHNKNKVEIVVPDDQVSLAIGRAGQNVRLASQMIGCDITIVSETQKQEDNVSRFNTMTRSLIDAMDVEEVIAQLLVAEGFISVEMIVAADLSAISKIQGFDINVAMEIQKRARDYLEEKESKYNAIIAKYDLKEDMLNLPGLTKENIAALCQVGITNVNSLAELASDELVEILLPENIKVPDAESAVLAARDIVYGA